MTSHSATPAKLKSGAWGARVTGSVKVGDVVTITTRAGKSWMARVERVVWSGDDVTLCATRRESGEIQSGAGSSAGGTYSRTQPRIDGYGRMRCSDCGGEVQSWSDGAAMGLCHDCV